MNKALNMFMHVTKGSVGSDRGRQILYGQQVWHPENSGPEPNRHFDLVSRLRECCHQTFLVSWKTCPVTCLSQLVFLWTLAARHCRHSRCIRHTSSKGKGENRSPDKVRSWVASDSRWQVDIRSGKDVEQPRGHHPLTEGKRLDHSAPEGPKP